MVDGLDVCFVVAFFVSALLAAFLYSRFRWWQHVCSNATEVMAAVRERESAPPNDGGPDTIEQVTLTYTFAEQ